MISCIRPIGSLERNSREIFPPFSAHGFLPPSFNEKGFCIEVLFFFNFLIECRLSKRPDIERCLERDSVVNPDLKEEDF